MPLEGKQRSGPVDPKQVGKQGGKKDDAADNNESWLEKLKKQGQDDQREQPWLSPLMGIVDDEINDLDDEIIKDGALVEMKSLAA